MKATLFISTLALAIFAGCVTVDHRFAFAEGVCTQAQDSRLLQPGGYQSCVLAVARDPQDR